MPVIFVLRTFILSAWRPAQAQPSFYTCAPPGAGVRMGVDRNGDGVFDRDDSEAGTEGAKGHPRN